MSRGANGRSEVPFRLAIFAFSSSASRVPAAGDFALLRPQRTHLLSRDSSHPPG